MSESNRISSLEIRVRNIELRLNEIQRIMANLISNKEINGLRVVLEDAIRDVAAEVAVIENDVSRIKSKLRL
jgi:ubiquinone biosynthesis protein UbiJ